MTQVYKVTISGIYLSQLNQNVMNFKSATGAGGTSADLATVIRDLWVEDMRFNQNIGYQYTEIKVQEMLPVPAVPIALDISSKTGTLTGAGYHPSIAVLFSFRTFDPSRHGRGRYYMGGVHGQTPLNGLVHPTALAIFAANAVTWTGRFCTGGSSIYKLSVGPRTYTSEADFQVCQTILARAYFGIMRKRNLNIGA